MFNLLLCYLRMLAAVLSEISGYGRRKPTETSVFDFSY